MDNNPFVTLRPMTAADIPAGMRLKDEAGWNQTESDWAMILNASPGGCFVAVMDEHRGRHNHNGHLWKRF